jgi:hypothetical protein
LRHGLATWTCDTCDMDLRHLRHPGLLIILLTSMAKTQGNQLALPPRPNSMVVLDGRIRGDCNGVTCRISRSIIIKAAALAGGRNQPQAMGASSAWGPCSYKRARRRPACSHKRAGQRSAHTSASSKQGAARFGSAARRRESAVIAHPCALRRRRFDAQRPGSADASNSRDQIARALQTHGSPGVGQGLPTGEGPPPGGIRPVGRSDRKMG